jgi:hypothetical protein
MNRPWRQALHPKFIVASSPCAYLVLLASAERGKVVVEREEVSAYSHALAMKLLLEGLLVALVLVAELVSLVALATRYTTTETHPSESRGSLAIAVVASEDGGGEAYRRVEWDPSSCGAWAVRSNSSESSGVEANSSSFSEAEAQEECRIGIRPHLATTRHPGVRPTTVRTSPTGNGPKPM